METMEAIKTRRSIRDYTDREVPEEVLINLIKAAMFAPSAGDEQPWEFIIIDREDILKKISQKQSNAHMVKDAPVAVLICADMSRVKYEDFWEQDCAAATQNFLLAAHELGLSSCWVGIHPRSDRTKDFNRLFDLPEQIIPFSVLPVGYPDENPPHPDRFDATRIRRNSW